MQRTSSADDIASLFKVTYIDERSNARLQEDVTVYAWGLFLQSIEERDVPVTFAELLTFSTGWDQIPPCGFAKEIDILFYNQESDSTRLPFVSTCGLQMWLPRNENPESLSRLLLRAVKESAGFLKV
ncbi:uncharacterized protein LOC132757168 [Ruditapes philippinarum]|uniref:uncharacterized protein LOC132757168 n=1 Tax=Ruditapes philippinarum TaxID=129788 RepID=UPI00295C1C1A|nr:uncharacterized protein LOC132757168 [Ruditapes philippinarum]